MKAPARNSGDLAFKSGLHHRFLMSSQTTSSGSVFPLPTRAQLPNQVTKWAKEPCVLGLSPFEGRGPYICQSLHLSNLLSLKLPGAEAFSCYRTTESRAGGPRIGFLVHPPTSRYEKPFLTDLFNLLLTSPSGGDSPVSRCNLFQRLSTPACRKCLIYISASAV